MVSSVFIQPGVGMTLGAPVGLLHLAESGERIRALLDALRAITDLVELGGLVQVADVGNVVSHDGAFQLGSGPGRIRTFNTWQRERLSFVECASECGPGCPLVGAVMLEEEEVDYPAGN